jgi:nitronate monooxygenase
MALPPVLRDRLRLPVIGSPLFIISNPDLVIAQCKAGIVGSFPALNARPASMLDEWLHRITEELAAWDRDHPEAPSAPFAVNHIVHKSSDRLEHDVEATTKWKAPIIITSLGAREDVNAAVHSYGGTVLHDVINDKFARKAIEKGADGLIPVAAGAGGHAGPPVAVRPDPGPAGVVRWADRAVGLDRPRPRGAGRPGDGRGPGLCGLGLHRDEGSQRRPGLPGHDRGLDRRGHHLHEPLHRRARQLPDASIIKAGLDPANLPTSDAVGDEFRFGRQLQGQSLARYLGLRPRVSARSRRSRPPPN